MKTFWCKVLYSKWNGRISLAIYMNFSGPILSIWFRVKWHLVIDNRP